MSDDEIMIERMKEWSDYAPHKPNPEAGAKLPPSGPPTRGHYAAPVTTGDQDGSGWRKRPPLI